MRSALRVRGAVAGAVIAGIIALAWPGDALAGKQDLSLLHLCEPRVPAKGQLNGLVPECSWVSRSSNGLIQQVAVSPQGDEQFRSVMSELGVVLAPRLVVPANTLGFSGFEIAAELGITSINRDRPYWNAAEGVAPDNPAAARPDAWLNTVGAFLRKGVWLGLPAVELGAGFVSLLDSHLLSWQGYAKVALHEGFHNWPLPSLAVRGGASYVTGSDQVRMTVTSLDVIASKGFGVLGTFRFEPYLAWSLLRISAESGVLDATPACDAYAVRTASGQQALGEHCSDSQRGTANDQLAYFSFAKQDPIVRQRLSAGAKIKFATVFLTAQYDLSPAGSSRDEKRPNGAVDGSGRQHGLTLSGGFDF